MSKLKKKGDTLHPSLKKMGRMLMDEVRAFTGMSYKEIDKYIMVDVPEHYTHVPSKPNSYRYALHPSAPQSRAPVRKHIQKIENRIARLLGRPAHRIGIVRKQKDPRAFRDSEHFQWHIEAYPEDGVSSREWDSADLEMRYEDNWPTFHELFHKDSPFIHKPIEKLYLMDGKDFAEWPEQLRFYSFQYGCLWDKNIPWLSKQKYGMTDDGQTGSNISATLVNQTITTPNLLRVFETRCFLGELYSADSPTFLESNHVVDFLIKIRSPEQKQIENLINSFPPAFYQYNYQTYLVKLYEVALRHGDEYRNFINLCNQISSFELMRGGARSCQLSWRGRHVVDSYIPS